jgi:RimK-like ATP-grasp domain
VILLCGIPSEAPVARAIVAAEGLGVPHVVLNQRQVDEWTLDLDLAGDLLAGTLEGPGGAWDLGEFAGVYVRLIDPQVLPDLGDPPDPVRLARAQALYQGLLAWLEVAPCRVANRLGPSASNMSKPYQAQRILESGLPVPPTTVTNDPDEVRRFASEHGRVIYKSASSTRSIVRELVGPRIKDLERVRHLPTQFQAMVPGVDVRVHVVGDAVLATEVISAATDYRYAGRDEKDVQMRACDVPADVEARCLALSEALELPLCGIDLRRTPDGRWLCFEANPSPAYSYYEEFTGQPIARALVTYLSEGAGSGDGSGEGNGASG